MMKLHHYWSGPFQVLECVGDSDYRVKMQRTGRVQVVHFDRLKPFVAGTRLGETGRTQRQPQMATSSAPQPEQLGEQLELLDAVDMEPLHKAENGEPAEQVEDLGPHPEVENREHLEEIPVVPGPPVVHAEEPPATLVAQENHQTAFKRRGSSVMENYMHVYIMPCTSDTRQ